MSTPSTPLVAASGADEIQDALVPAPNSAINFADDAVAKEWVLENVVPLLQSVRADGSAQREEWAEIRKMGLLKDGKSSAYAGQSRAYLPVYQKARETRVSHLGQGLFPSDSYLDCSSEDPQLEPFVPANKAWMKEQIDRSMRLRAEIKPWLRSLADFGIGIGKVWWEKTPKSVKGVSMTRLPGIAEVLHTYGEQAAWSCDGARFKTRSPFSWYIWPVNVASIDEATLVFEDIEVSKQFVDQMSAAGIWKNKDMLEEVLASSNSETLDPRIRTYLQDVRASSTAASDLRQGDLANFRVLSECWLRMPVPNALYLPNERQGEAVPVKVVLCNGVPIEIRRNPFWHQKPPYVMYRSNETVDSFYGVGMGRTMLSLQGLINDFINQTNDNGIYGLNPIIKYNPNTVVGPLEPLAPGRMIPLTDPAGMIFDRPPVEQLQYGLMLTNQLITYANDMSGVPAVLQGSGAKGGAKTATGSQILQGNVKGELQDIIEDIELMVMVQIMNMVHALGQQYESRERFIAISGQEKIQFARDQLLGQFAWKWVASSQAVNQQQRAQQTTAFLQVAANPGVLQLLMQQGKMLNPEPVLRMLWEGGLGLRNFDQIITPAPMMPGMPPGGGGGLPPGAAPSGQDPRSAVEQAPGGSEGMVPGEGQAFMDVRAQADEMAAMMGAAGGAGGYE